MFELRVKGIVQGVGFRPFMYQLCTKLDIKGYIFNIGADAIIVCDMQYAPLITSPRQAQMPHIRVFYPVQIKSPNILLPNTKLQSFFDLFLGTFTKALPPIAKITELTISSMPTYPKIRIPQYFEILHSIKQPDKQHITLDSALPKDLATCKDCQDEISNPKNRHFGYHLTSCTNCGARYSIIKSLPYDRYNTAMKHFTLCKDCQDDYTNPMSRYYHAQPISCNNCAVPIMLYKNNSILAKDSQAIRVCADLLKDNQIICLKGLGGFVLICNAQSRSSIIALRQAKNREAKPLAIMAKDIQMALDIANLSPLEQEYLKSQIAPIIIATQNPQNPLNVDFESIAPHLNTIGILLANTPLLHILFGFIDFPIIYTSANLKSEPIITTLKSAKTKLKAITPYFLDFKRAIYHGIDDSIFRLIDNQMRPFRLARGATPHTITTPALKANHNILALGAQDKVDLCFGSAHHFLITPYIGDMASLETQNKYFQNLTFFKKIYSFTPAFIISDAHPQYQTTGIATYLCNQHNNSNPKTTALQNTKNPQNTHSQAPTHLQIYHHHAHLCAILAESNLPKDEQILGIIWDGSGYGESQKESQYKKNSIWGGEFLYGGFGGFERVGHFEEFLLLGGERAIKNIQYIAYALALQSQNTQMIQKYQALLPHALTSMANKALYTTCTSATHTSNICTSTIYTSSVGRLFDGVAALIGVLEHSSYEGESGGIFEAMYDSHINDYYEFYIKETKEVSTSTRDTHNVKKPNKHQEIITLDFISQIILDSQNHIAPYIIATKFINTLAHIALSFSLRFLRQTPNLKLIGLSGGVFQNKALCEKIALLFNQHHIQYIFHAKVPTNDNGISFGQAAFGAYHSQKE
ncbi:carbamoyltransferase HypF [Helicobacter fennelliae]